MGTKEENQRYYKKNKKLYLDKNRENRQERRKLVDSYKDVPCSDCGIQYPPFVMDFDHRDPKIKEFTIGMRYYAVSIVKLLAEIEKCDVVCANCHRIRSHNTGVWRSGSAIDS